MTPTSRFATLVTLVALVAGCGQQPVNVVPPSFSRPEDLVFTCVNMVFDPDPMVAGDEGPALVPLDRCEGLQGTSSETKVLIALMTQTSTGEVAAVDLREDEPLDSRDVVPGYTFLRVGEVPSGIAIAPSDKVPNVTYVANYGSQGVMAIPTTWFFPPELGLIERGDPGFTFENVNLPGAPTDLAISDDGLFLFAPIPSLGVVAQLAIDADGGFVRDMAGDVIVVEIPVSAAAAIPVPPPNDPTVLYERICPQSYPVRAATTRERTPVVLGTGPQPLRVLVDGDTLLVADASEPVVHRFDMGAYGVFTDDTASTFQSYSQLATAVPVTALAVTPEVPATLTPGQTSADDPARFLYAIDAVDQSILAMDYLESSPTYGAVVASQVGNPPSDRIRTVGTGKARTLEVIHPGYYDGASEAPYCSSVSGAAGFDFNSDAGPTFLRGVFLVAAMTDGSLRFFDVHDLDAPCRGSTCTNTDTTSSDEEVYIQRHRARVGTYLQRSIELASTPALSFGSSPGRLGTDGQPTSGSGPGLEVLTFDAGACPFPPSAYFETGCPPYMKPVYGETDLPVICAQSDPWGVVGQSWAGTWQGALPGTQGGRGRLVFPGAVGSVALSDPFIGFCDRGVLGTDDIAASGLGPDDPEAGYGGDQLVILSDVPEHKQSDPACEAFLIPDSSTEERDTIAFRIVTASQDTLELEPIGGVSLANLETCFPDPVAFEVRTRGAYTVLGAFDGFAHRVIDGGGQCLVDTSQAVDPCDPLTYRNGRALPGEAFLSPQLAFQIEATPTIPSGSQAQLTLSLGQTPPQLSLDAGTQPVTLRFNPTDGYLYSVDTDTLGLARIDLQPLSRIDTIQ